MTNFDTNTELPITKLGGLDHTSDMSEEEHCKFVIAFSNYKEQTDFTNEFSPIMLKYYVQMAFLEGWKKGKASDQ